MNKYIIISGCSGGGKTALLEELKRRGHHTIDEPGRRIVRQEMAGNGAALPWRDCVAFVNRAIEMSISDYEAARSNKGWTFFDRGLIDALAALEHVNPGSIPTGMALRHRFNPRVFLAPPWPEIFVNDSERRHGFDAAEAEFRRLERVYPSLGYEVILLPKTDIASRADHVLTRLE
jgi:predicted ATPase